MDSFVYSAIWYALLIFAVGAAYSNHKTSAAIAGVGFIILGVLILLSPLEVIVGEVITNVA